MEREPVSEVVTESDEVTTLVTSAETGSSVALKSTGLFPVDELDQARAFIRASKAESTLRGYQSDWKHFAGWCDELGAQPLPAAPELVAAYLADCAAWLSAGSIQRRVNAIAEAHKAAGFESPTGSGIVRNTLKGIRRTLGTDPARQKAPALTEDICKMAGLVDGGLIGARDRALILVGFAGAFRRSELVGLNIEDLEFGAEGLTILLRRSKTDQEGLGRKVGIPPGENPQTCAVEALKEWLRKSWEAVASSPESKRKLAGRLTEKTLSNIIDMPPVSGPLFLSIDRHGKLKDRCLSAVDVARVVKKLAARAGLDPAKYAGHSLRSGHATSASIRGASEREIMNQTGHRSVEMVRRYIRDANLFRGNSAGKLGL